MDSHRAGITAQYYVERIHVVLCGAAHYVMFDGIKIQDVSVKVDSNGQPALLTNSHLTFGSLVDGQTGVILNPVRTAYDRGLTFRLVPRRTGRGDRVEVKGSLHKFFNNGLHNADQYTVNDLLLTLDQLVRYYGFDLYSSVINNIEFGVNLELPFPVSQVLNNLICYKNQPFAVDSQSQTPYYICQRQRYAVKLYDKGKQKGLDYHLLRFEIRVKKMRYFDGTGVRLHTLADLLNVANYGPLGSLLVDTFTDILVDDSAIDTKSLSANQRKIYQQGRNPRYWHTPDDLTLKQAAAHRQRLSRNKDRFRALLDQYGSNWQKEVITLIRQTWAQLTDVDNDLLRHIDANKTTWQNLIKPDFLPEFRPATYSEQINLNGVATSHELTAFPSPDCHKLTTTQIPPLSRINPLYSGVTCDRGKTDPHSTIPDEKSGSERRGAATPGAAICPITGVLIEQPKPGQRFVTAAMLRTDDDLMLTLDQQHQQYAKGSKEDIYSQAAHNVRNQDSNPRNNLRRQINRFNQKKGGQQFLFPEFDTFPLTYEQRALLDYWKGTRFEVSI